MSDIKAFLFDDDRGVSPVIGVILMVAITVILAAVIAAFVLGLGDTSEPTPSTSFDFDYNETGQALTVTVQGGDTFDAVNANVTVDGSNSASLSNTAAFGDALGSSISAGDTFVVNDSSVADVTVTSRVDITFTPDAGGEAAILGTFTGPERS